MSSNPDDDKLFRRYHPTQGWLMPISEHRISHGRLIQRIQELETRLQTINDEAECFQYAPLDTMRKSMARIIKLARG